LRLAYHTIAITFQLPIDRTYCNALMQMIVVEEDLTFRLITKPNAACDLQFPKARVAATAMTIVPEVPVCRAQLIAVFAREFNPNGRISSEQTTADHDTDCQRRFW
jgi:hypothetical protein